MKATKKPKRPNPFRSNIGFVKVFAFPHDGVGLITRTGHYVQHPLPLPIRPSLGTGKAKRHAMRQPAGYYSQGTIPRFLGGMSPAKREKANWRKSLALEPICPNCGERGRHFMPPSLGQPGYFYCPR